MISSLETYAVVEQSRLAQPNCQQTYDRPCLRATERYDLIGNMSKSKRETRKKRSESKGRKGTKVNLKINKTKEEKVWKKVPQVCKALELICGLLDDGGT